MYQALYRKYRPSTFDDVCGQEHITSVLKTQLQKGRVSHAYIFCGSRGTGKTTCAKILAKAVNCLHPVNGEPCNECESCIAINEERVMDVVEMDAASNNGVDHIRRLCDEVQFMPSESKKRVYIVDEVHMLSTSAFNALLKTIEEPPAHVLFILATTEMNDIPATIMSRCQRFDFKRIPPKVIAQRLMNVAQKEQIPLQKDAAGVIARLSDGAMRDALSLLEACQGHQGEITVEKIHSILGISSKEQVIELCRAVTCQDAPRCLSLIRELYDKMSDFKVVIGEVIAIFRDLLVIRTVKDYNGFVESYGNELALLEEIAGLVSTETILFQTKELENFYVTYDRIATEKKAASEILMLRLCNENMVNSNDALLSRIAKLEKALEAGEPLAVPKTSVPVRNESEKEKEVSPGKPKAEESKEEETVFSGAIKLKNRLQKETFIKPWLDMLTFRKEGSVLHIVCGAFVQGMLASSNAQEILTGAAADVDPQITSVVFDVADEKKNNSFPSDFEGL